MHTDGKAAQDENSAKIDSDRAFFYDFVKFEVNATAQRNQIFLFIQSILMASIASWVDKTSIFFPVWIFIVLGLTLSVFWLYLNCLTRIGEVAALDQLEKIDPRVVLILSARNEYKILKLGGISVIMNYIIPSVIFITWIALCIYYIISIY